MLVYKLTKVNERSPERGLSRPKVVLLAEVRGTVTRTRNLVARAIRGTWHIWPSMHLVVVPCESYPEQVGCTASPALDHPEIFP